MKKSFILVFIFFSVFTQIQAQKVQYGIAPVIRIPLGYLSSSYTFAYGVEVDIKYPISKKIEFFGTLGYQKIIGKEKYNPWISGIGGNAYKVPNSKNYRVLVGGRYLMGNIFAGFSTGLSNEDSFGSEISFNPQIGYRMKRWDLVSEFVSNNTIEYFKPTLDYIGLKSIFYFSIKPTSSK